MVNTGRPSQGCFACRRKKTRCDLARPQCDKCTRIPGRTCPGYPDTLVFRNASASRPAAGSAWQGASMFPTSPSSPLPPDMSPAAEARTVRLQPSFYESMQSRVAVRSSPIPEHPPPTVKQILPMVFRHLRPQALQSAPQGWSVTAEIYAHAPRDSSLSLAILALAYTVASLAAPGNAAITYEAKRIYGQALSATQAALYQHDLAVHDQTLMTLQVMMAYEFLRDDELGGMGQHQAGCELLLRYRDAHRPPTRKFDDNTGVFKEVITNLLYKYLFHSQRPTPELVRIIDSYADPDPAAMLLRHGIDVADLVASEPYDIPAFVQQAIILDTQLEAWSNPGDTMWQRTKIRQQASARWPGAASIFRSTHVARMWNLCYALRIILHDAIISKAISRPEMMAGFVLANGVLLKDQVAQSRLLMTLMVEEIVLATPFMLAQIDALPEVKERLSWMSEQVVGCIYQTWPLSVVLKCPLATPKQKRTAVRALEHIGHAWNIQWALRFVASDR